MNTTNISQKRIYYQPQMKWLKLDNEISLVVESTPPLGPGEFTSTTHDYFKTDHFKINNT